MFNEIKDQLGLRQREDIFSPFKGLLEDQCNKTKAKHEIVLAGPPTHAEAYLRKLIDFAAKNNDKAQVETTNIC